LALHSLVTLLAACCFGGSVFGVGLGPFDAAAAAGLLFLVSGRVELVELAVWAESDDELDAEWADEEDEADTYLDDRLDGIDSSVLSATVGLLLFVFMIS
jgi:hypothetical protein